MSQEIAITLAVVGIQLMVPILWAALGELVSEKAGVLNVGIEGVMLIGAWAAAFAGVTWGSPALSVVAAVIGGLLAGALLAALYVRLGTDQIVTGLLFNVFALGLTDALHNRYIQGSIGRTLGTLDVPVLRDVPVIGRILTQQNLLLYLGLLAVVAITFLMSRTWWGLHARGAGERPYAVESSGLDVWRLRYPAVLVGCALPAVGGAALVLGSAGGFVPGMTAGRGFIALGVVVLARWSAPAVLAASLFFGVAQSLQFVAGRVGFLSAIPSQFWLMTPYLVTVVAVVVARGSRYPAAIGIPYRRPDKATASP